MKLGVDCGPDSRTRIVSNRGYEYLGKEVSLPPLSVPIAIQATSTCDEQWNSFRHIRFCELMKDIEHLVAKNTYEVAKFGMFYAHVVISQMASVCVRAQFEVRAVLQQKIDQLFLVS